MPSFPSSLPCLSKRGEDSDSDSGSDLGPCDGIDERSLPDEERAFYRSAVAKSEGFDVPEIIAGYLYNLIQPRDLNTYYHEFLMYKGHTQLAIDEYNRRFAETNAKLELVKVSKVMAHLYDNIRYYITFEARDLADGGKTKTYQAVVRHAIPEISVLSFRLKPVEDEQGKGVLLLKVIDLSNYLQLCICLRCYCFSYFTQLTEAPLLIWPPPKFTTNGTSCTLIILFSVNQLLIFGSIVAPCGSQGEKNLRLDVKEEALHNLNGRICWALTLCAYGEVYECVHS